MSACHDDGSPIAVAEGTRTVALVGSPNHLAALLDGASLPGSVVSVSIVSITLDGRAVDVITEAGDWAVLAPLVDAAVRADPAAVPDWPATTTDRAERIVPSCSEVQTVVDVAAGGVFVDHGRSLVVTGVSHDGNQLNVTVDGCGACNGCHGAPSTMRDAMLPALRRAFGPTTIDLAPPGSPEPGDLMIPVSFRVTT